MVLPVCMNLVSIEARRGHWIDHLKQVLQRFLHGCWGEKKKKIKPQVCRSSQYSKQLSHVSIPFHFLLI